MLMVLFRRFQGLGRRAYCQKKELFSQVKRSLKIQFILEEEMLYPALVSQPTSEIGSRLAGILEEHLLIDHLLLTLSESPRIDRTFDHRMDALRRRAEEHFRLERRGPYEEIRHRLNKDALERLGAEMRSRILLMNGRAVAG